MHDNIAASVAAIRKMGQESGFIVDASDDPGVFTDGNLRQYAALVFSNSNNQAFSDDAQRDAFKHYIEAGGGFVGLHSASGSERDWPYFWSVLGGKFVAHPHQQPFTVRVVDPGLRRRQRSARRVHMDRRVLLSRPPQPGYPSGLGNGPDKTRHEPMTIDVTKFPVDLPLAWYQEFDGGREFYLALGHNKEDYANPLLYGIIRNGILWAMKPGR